MILEVRLEGGLERFRPDRVRSLCLEVPAGSTVFYLIGAAGLPWEAVGAVAVNGVHVCDGHLLQRGDQVILMAPLEGG